MVVTNFLALKATLRATADPTQASPDARPLQWTE